MDDIELGFGRDHEVEKMKEENRKFLCSPFHALCNTPLEEKRLHSWSFSYQWNLGGDIAIFSFLLIDE